MPTVDLKDHQLFYDDRGAGTPVVLLSGLGGDHRAFTITARHLAKTHRVLTIDHRDAGQSSRANADYSTRDLAQDVASWLEKLDIPAAHVVGHSLGGLVAQELALAFRARVRTLILASTHAGANSWRKAVIQSWMMARTQNEPGAFTIMTLPWLVAPTFYENPSQVAGMVRFAETNRFAQDSSAFIRQAKAAAEHDARDRLKSLLVPTLILVGELDLVNPPPISEELTRLIQGAELVVLPRVGHLPHIEDGINFRRLVSDFIARYDSSH